MKKNINFYIAPIIIMWFFGACKKESGTGYLSPELKYRTATINVITGRSIALSDALLTDESTKPLECSIASIHDTLGNELTKLMDYKVNTFYWTGSPTGLETSLDQIDSIRKPVLRPAIDINPENGQVIIYREASDTTLFPKGIYVLDIKVKNSSGERILKNALTIITSPAGPYSYHYAGVDQIKGMTVTFNRLDTTHNKLIIRTLRNDGSAIDPKTLFGYDYGTAENPNLKDWHNLGLQKIVNYTEFVDRIEIEVAGVPIPVIGGLPAGQGIPLWGQRIDMYNNGDAIGKYFNYWFDFGIFEKGTWEIIIKLEY